ncbi:MAG: bifunctional phosphopantothenoylcysteine decarboxylase/phosphopantothenate--cysteine ligase CoaBC [Solirubrobacterales bacterium]|nr:bifunctional phosphopantothenoylcysteine decarboxylase/phosphopantothenate--cysteine ligase CoaBC [Solirubrobacterales bacterium]
MARILLGVTGGIAAYKALELVRLATAAGHAVRVVQTEAAQRFVGAASFAALTGAPVLTSEWERDPARGAFPDQAPPGHDPLSHLELVANADVFVVAPAGANTIAKLAHGLADNLLSSAALAATCPLVLAPAMNVHMWEHPATRANLALLAERGALVVAPTEGRLGSIGEWGMGRLAEPAAILAAAESVAPAGDGGGPWDGLHVLVTAGGTREPIDAVRYVGNRSSGRMGFALAAAAADRGARVTVVAANVALPRDPRVAYLDVTTAAELQVACEEAFASCDVLLMAAAVADFRPTEPAANKLKKSGRAELLVRMEPTADVLSGLSAARRPGQVLVGFAAETGAGALDYGRQKLARKRLDAVVVNDVAAPGIGFEGGENEVTVLTAAGEHHVARSAKSEVASAILSVVERMRETTTAGPAQ